MNQPVRLVAWVACLATWSCGRGTGPDAVASNFYDAQLHGRFDEAYGYVSAQDRTAKTLETYKTDDGLRLAALFTAKISFRVKSSQVTSDRAKVILTITHPDYSGMMQEVMGAPSASALGGKPDLEAQKAIADQLARTSAPMKTDDASFALRKFSDGWKVATGWAAKAKIADANKLVEQKNFEAAKTKYQEALALGADAAELKGTIDALDTQIAAKREQDEYLVKVVVGNVSTHLNSGRPFDESEVFGEVKNRGDKALNEVEVAIYCLDESDKPVFEKTYSPVRVNQFNFDGETSQPLKPNYSRKFGVRMQGAPVDCHGTIDVKATRVVFVP